MRKIIFFLIIINASFTIAQTKYLIYFKDKGVNQASSFQKSSSLYKIAEQQLSLQAIERRKQVLGEDNYITFEDIPLNENYIHQVESLGISIANKLKWFNAVSAYLTIDQLNLLKDLPFVEKIEGVRVFKKRNDENNLNGSNGNSSEQTLKKTTSATGLNYGQSLTQNALSDIPAVHDLGINGKGVYVGILDDGFSWRSHISLKNLKVLREYDYVQKDNDAQIQSGHGQAVFSIMAGYDPGNIIGPAHDANFYLAKTENYSSETKVEEDNYAAAIQDMENAGVQITSSSLGYNQFDDPSTSYTFANMDGNTAISTKALNLAFNFGVSTFTAAGNERGNSWNHIIAPADAVNVMAVGAVTSFNSISSFSSPGPTSDGRIKPEIVAMGSSVYHANSIGSYSSGNGTSYATPIAAGIAALLKSAWPHLTNVQIRKIFLECGDNTTSPNNDRGWGLISAKKAVAYPNLSQSNNAYNILNKIFINSNGVVPSTVAINYRIGDSIFQTAPMNQETFNNTVKYSFQLPSTTSGTAVEFFFTYLDNTTQLVREPADNTNYILPFSDVKDPDDRQDIPTEFTLLQNYPNPFNPSTIISYKLPVGGFVSLKVFDMLGREVATLVNEIQQPGTYNSQFSTGSKVRNSQLSSGVYFYRLQTDNFVSTKKMVLIK